MNSNFDQVGACLRYAFDAEAGQPLPPAFQAILDRLGSTAAVTSLSDEAFKRELAAAIPSLRTLGWSLSGSRDRADDLVQQTMMRAWTARARFRAGTSMRAWTYRILRNEFLSSLRRARFVGEWDEGVAERRLVEPASQGSAIELADIHRALQRLPVGQREALLLAGPGGLTYEEASDVLGCALGTIKSRVSRGRAALEAMIEDGLMPPRPSGVHHTSALADILAATDAIRDRR